MPQWVFGMSSYAFASPDTDCLQSHRAGRFRLGLDRHGTGKLTTSRLPLHGYSVSAAANGQAVFRGGSPTDVASIVKFDLATGQFETLRRSNDLEVYPHTFRCRGRSSFRLKAD
jgi:hypothetical protein